MKSLKIKLPILPIKNTVVFPGVAIPLYVGRAISLAALEEAQKTEDKQVVVLTQSKSSIESPAEADLFKIGTLASVSKALKSERGQEIMVAGEERVRLVSLSVEKGYLLGEFEKIPVSIDSGSDFEAMHRSLLRLTKKYESYIDSRGKALIDQLVAQTKDPMAQIYVLASILPMDIELEQKVLEANSAKAAMEIMHQFLSHEIEVLELQKKIASRTEGRINEQQKEHILRQQLESIKAELGDSGGSKKDIQDLRKKIDDAKVPEAVKLEVEREYKKLEELQPGASEYQLVRAYLELVSELPWDKTTVDNLDLSRARKILDEDHYDLRDAKSRIVEHLAVLKLNPNANAPIICFVGPPGVGKTSLGESMARALGRKFERMSFGGLHDEAELRGHRRTYIGPMPGRILQALRRAGTKNPLLMLDEVDKIGHDYRGDPAAALLEILDPAQNHSFRDNYLDLPFDLSKAFFVCTANNLDTIPRPLLDRMEIIHLAGYSEEEKAHIAQRYIVPQKIKDSGLATEQIIFTDESIKKIISDYTREAGVRDLGRKIASIARKVALKIAEDAANQVTIGSRQVVEFLGSAKFFKEHARQKPTVGVATGLAWTPYGGEVLYIESSLLPRGKGLTLTGQLGDVMKESAQAAQTYIWTHAKELGVSLDMFEKNGVHIHIPEGATPKDGPSAGVTMATALASLYMGIPVRSDTAMTGEITLTGLVLPIGGLKEKILAAHRSGIKRILIPKANQKDLSEIPEHVTNDLEIIAVDDLMALFKNVLLYPDSGVRQTVSAS